MFRNGDDGYGGGGFDVSGYGASETPQADKKGSRRTDRIVPVTIRQVLQSSDEGVKVGNFVTEGQMVEIVGIVKTINRSSVKVIYTLEDNTGQIEGLHWLDADADESLAVPVVENTYCVMVGKIRQGGGENDSKNIMVFTIYPVTDLNYVTAHMLEVIYVSLKSEDLAQQTPVPAAQKEMSSTYGGMDNLGGGSDYAAGFNLNPQQQRVLKAVIQNSQSENGVSIDDVLSSLTVKMPLKELEKVLEFLSSEGHVYSTKDERHFKATDNLN